MAKAGERDERSRIPSVVRISRVKFSLRRMSHWKPGTRYKFEMPSLTVFGMAHGYWATTARGAQDEQVQGNQRSGQGCGYCLQLRTSGMAAQRPIRSKLFKLPGLRGRRRSSLLSNPTLLRFYRCMSRGKPRMSRNDESRVKEPRCNGYEYSYSHG